VLLVVLLESVEMVLMLVLVLIVVEVLSEIVLLAFGLAEMITEIACLLVLQFLLQDLCWL
jgi:hypothetical protein